MEIGGCSTALRMNEVSIFRLPTTVLVISMSSRAGRERKREKESHSQIPDLQAPEEIPMPGPSQPALAMARRDQGLPESAQSCWPRIPHVPLKSVCSAHTTPHPHREQSPPHPGQGLQLLLPAPAASPLPSLTSVDQLQLFLLPPQVSPAEPCKHRACHGQCHSSLPALWPLALLAWLGSAQALVAY